MQEDPIQKKKNNAVQYNYTSLKIYRSIQSVFLKRLLMSIAQSSDCVMQRNTSREDMFFKFYLTFENDQQELI